MSLTSRVHTSWQLLQSSIRVLRDRPRLLVFPVVAGLCPLSLALFFFAPFLLIRMGQLTPDMSGGRDFAPAFYAWGGVVYLGALFLATFCNVAFYHETPRAFAGGLQLGALMLLGAMLITISATVSFSLLLHLGSFPRVLFASGMLLGMIAVGALMSVATDIFRCALYVYASEGVVPPPYPTELLNAGWKMKKS